MMGQTRRLGKITVEYMSEKVAGRYVAADLSAARASKHRAAAHDFFVRREKLAMTRFCAGRAAWIMIVVLLTAVCGAAQEGELRSEAPKGVTTAQIIEKFAAREAVYKKAREQYTWRQDVRIQTLEGKSVDGEYREVFDVTFDKKGRRAESVVFAPVSSLQRILLTPEDLQDIRQRMPFVLTTQEIPEYNIIYVGRQKIDEVDSYVFDIHPKTMEKGKRYFDGRIWVDDRDFQIVKTYGKSVPDIVKKGGDENLFPRFTTYREQIDGEFWFPTYTKVDDTLHFSYEDVHTRQIIKYTDYKRFGARSRILLNGQELEHGGAQAPEGKPAEDAPKK